jgi:hypothetical protein
MKEACSKIEVKSKHLLYSDTNTHLFGYIALEKFHKGIARAIEKNGSEDVIKSLEQVRSCVLASPLNVHFAGDPEKLANETQEATARWKFLANDVSKNKLEVGFFLYYRYDVYMAYLSVFRNTAKLGSLKGRHK